MPYLKTEQTVSVTDTGSAVEMGGATSTIKLKVTIDEEGKVSYTLTAINDKNTTHPDGIPWIYKGLYVKLNGIEICSEKYYTDINSFPAKHNSTKSGTAGTTTTGSISYDLRVNSGGGPTHGWDSDGTTKDYKGTKKTGTITRTSYTNLSDSNIGKPTITGVTGKNAFKVSYSKTGKGGTNNPVTKYSLYWRYKTTDDYTMITSKCTDSTFSKEINFNPDSATKKDGKATIRVRLTAYADHPTESDSKIEKTEEAEVLYYTDVEPEKPTITDNGNNTFTIKADSTTAGVNNPVDSNTLYYKIGTGNDKSVKGLKLEGQSITATSNTASQRVQAYVVSKGANFNSDSIIRSNTATADIKNYQAPGAPGIPVINYTKSKLTLRENWTLSWDAASPTNTSSPVKGYRIRVYVNGQSIPIKSTTGQTLTTDTGSSNGTERYHYDRESTETSLVFDPVLNGINVDDEVSLSILAYARNGKGTILPSGKVTSSTYLVQNAGIVHVRIGNTWKEGQTYIRIGGAWKEAESVQIRIGGEWKEAQ